MEKPRNLSLEISRLLDACAVWAAEGAEPSRDLLSAVRALPLPRLAELSQVRPALWKILSHPERARALTLLNEAGLLEEIFIAWDRGVAERDLSLRAVEQVHRERWACGLGERAMQTICAFHDRQVDDRLNGWAYTGLATLLAHHKSGQAYYLSRIHVALMRLQATSAEAERIIAILTEFPLVYAHLSQLKPARFEVLPATLIAALSTLLADEQFSEEHCSAAVQLTDRWLQAL